MQATLGCLSQGLSTSHLGPQPPLPGSLPQIVSPEVFAATYYGSSTPVCSLPNHRLPLSFASQAANMQGTCREQGDPGTSTLVMPRRVGVRSHRFMKVVLLLAILPIPMVVLLLHRLVVLLPLLLTHVVTAVGMARGPPVSPGEISGSPRPRLQITRPRLQSFRPRERRYMCMLEI